jgi:hypothetical protein
LEIPLLRILREPLVHFLLIGAALFAIYRYLPPAAPALTQQPVQAASPSGQTPSRQIVLSVDGLSRLATLFQAQWGRDPTPKDLDRLVEAEVQEEILYREGLALGLDKDDEIVRRRMAQKMQFLAENVAAAHEPTDAELKTWYDQNQKQFVEPARVSFRHLYFSPDRRGASARSDAEKALGELNGEAQNTRFAGADPFMFQDYYRDKTSEYLNKEFGPSFATGLEKIPIGSWQGPIESGFGWHLIYVDTVIPARAPSFEEIIADVKQAWLSDQKARAVKQAYEDLRTKYTVLLPAPPPEGAPPLAKANPQAAIGSIPAGVLPQ